MVLVAPQLGENIGMCARAMLNCGLDRLRLVSPRQGWPSVAARATAAGAGRVLDQAEIFDSVEAAVADCHRVIATTARDRSQAIPVWGAEEAAGRLRESATKGETCAVLFGPEASGLDADALVHADAMLKFPTNPDFSSLNLAQAVLLFGWEWRRGGLVEVSAGNTETASREKLEVLIGRIESELDRRGFFLTPELKPHSLRTMRSIFTRSRPTEAELNFLHGLVTALTREPAE